MLALSSIDSDACVLEIGCGTGQATVPLAKRGVWIDAVELGAMKSSITALKDSIHVC